MGQGSNDAQHATGRNSHNFGFLRRLGCLLRTVTPEQYAPGRSAIHDSGLKMWIGLLFLYAWHGRPTTTADISDSPICQASVDPETICSCAAESGGGVANLPGIRRHTNRFPPAVFHRPVIDWVFLFFPRSSARNRRPPGISSSTISLGRSRWKLGGPARPLHYVATFPPTADHADDRARPTDPQRPTGRARNSIAP